MLGLNDDLTNRASKWRDILLRTGEVGRRGVYIEFISLDDHNKEMEEEGGGQTAPS